MNRCTFQFLKILFVILNRFIYILGIFSLAVGLIVAIRSVPAKLLQKLVKLNSPRKNNLILDDLTKTTLCFIISSSLLLFFCYIGWCGMIKKSKFVLSMYIAMILILINGFLSSHISAIIVKYKIDKYFKDVWLDNLMNQKIFNIMNLIERTFKCCGVNSFYDYQLVMEHFPPGCCGNLKYAKFNCTKPYDQGCYIPLKRELIKSVEGILYASPAVVIFQLLILAVAVAILSKINEEEDTRNALVPSFNRK